MKVKLIAATNLSSFGSEPIDTVETAAAVCYDSTPDLCKHRVSHSCMESGHLSVWEHLNLTFSIEGISRACLAQLSRHRHISLSVRSQRYVDESRLKVVTPPSIQKDADAQQIYEDAIAEAYMAYDRLLKLGVLKEDARFLLPNATCTKLYMTCNARALTEMSHLRLCNRAQWEIRELFEQIKKTVERSNCSELAQYLVPKCKAGRIFYCPERKRCGLNRNPGKAVTTGETS
ncbi:MAG: FAD-dependent thymidylate synthase [Eubacteriales bacterium]|nr:FAD-dependent thymidylate synthase [Eubacteriales bacterium]